ncbi:MAG TPA: hypothetical protein VFZ76_07850 [Anaerolineales bacterium]
METKGYTGFSRFSLLERGLQLSKQRTSPLSGDSLLAGLTIQEYHLLGCVQRHAAVLTAGQVLLRICAQLFIQVIGVKFPSSYSGSPEGSPVSLGFRKRSILAL